MSDDALPEEASEATELPEVPDELMSTGIAGLDEMLGGSIPVGSTVFVCGATGSGKTILAQQMAFATVAGGERISDRLLGTDGAVICPSRYRG